jgi:hypothetical protein
VLESRLPWFVRISAGVASRGPFVEISPGKYSRLCRPLSPRAELAADLQRGLRIVGVDLLPADSPGRLEPWVPIDIRK